MKRSRLFNAAIAILMAIVAFACSKQAAQQEETIAEAGPNTLTEEEKAAGWELLFDGTSLNGWKRYNSDTI